MKNTNKDISNQELLEFIKDTVATKDDLKEFKNDIIEKLDGVSKQLTDVLSENGANLSAHDRFEHRDEVFAKKLDLNLNAVDAES